MHPRALTRALTALVALTLGATLATVTPAYADNVDPQAPVVVADTITLWPGESHEINVLTNDSDPAGDDLAVCRLPPSMLGSGRPTPVSAFDGALFGLPAGTLMVSASPNARGTHTIDYYVCNHTRLTPATLTVVIRPVDPVEVTKVPGKPGLLRVTNDNDRRIRFLAMDRTGCKLDAHGAVPAGRSRTFKVHRRVVGWFATIGAGGVAGHGTVRGIHLDEPPAPAGNPDHVCSYVLSSTSMDAH